ncbi:hypothetical protein IQ37_19580 [Chryseobacterium piperi]|uniref:Uncharacterized protein n=1 Tax=Chryseobacterium piperi TaxID=558152 RepID=A0A086A2F5_9FLAO|nr:hypothetical protein [Chryseobacterium piperi]ASW76311.1 hypothetical protein CJF12_19895 [Chryseobacterium piperi]KFF10869.1 hypothetical protein IQ37_19580 [Chryseobacterium piperi]
MVNITGIYNYVGEEIIRPIQAKIDSDLQSDQIYNQAIEKQMDDFPLNDTGKERIINFYALGSLWEIKFANTYEILSIAEEYISTIQITLAEIALSNIDFHLLKSKIEIELFISNKYLPPEELPSNHIIKWKVYICYTDTKDVKEINNHAIFNITSLLHILNKISLLKSDEFKDLFISFLKNAALGTKQTTVNLYQKIHRDIYASEDFKAFKPYSFLKENFLNLNLPTENKVMAWDDSLSAKYDQTFSLESIKNRFNNTHKCIHLTLKELEQNSEFPLWLNNLRTQGFKDWQIVSNMQNFMVNYKIQVFESKTFDSEAEFVEHNQKIFLKYTNMDEKDCYIRFPLEAFQSEEFMNQFNLALPSTLMTYGLETKLITPNFTAIKEFLNIRFNIQFDDYNINNPLRDIN